MVCLQEEDTVVVTVRDTIGSREKNQELINLSPNKSIESIFEEIATYFEYNPESIELTLHKGPENIILSKHRDKLLSDLGITCTMNDFITVSVKLYTTPLYVQDAAEDDLLLGASASPTTGEIPSSGVLPQLELDFQTYIQSPRTQTRPVLPESTNYVGLVNQAMTCYLNSLLQALYMTPEFRNALYNWVFDGQNETRSIPYQLQKLFLNLQTSTKSAVETTDLTTSFGWQGSDAWHQHDIQELCRVMFDALEQKFKDTEQANLINDLYEGKMLDYVKCLECGTEKSREDTFLDIPLPVRPFGSNVAYNSVEEALRAFVQPETLDGNNQYHCEKCNKKCDAHKGLKFTKFPYLLTLHLKRFDFDYNTMHRIKLNDKVVFPEKLNLNSFVPTSRTENDVMEEREHTAVKCDDCSTTDSGSADDESCQGTDVSSTVNGQDDNCADSDEGIDVSSGNNHIDKDAKGPYVYELFSIMIHSGSASGGHYYAYIKDFDKNLWFCFNDQSVTGITEDDIRKTYGGGPQRGYYSGAYSSSTNAYMLMYRQIDKDRNCRAMTVENFPVHIQKLLEDMLRKEEEDRKNREKENDMIKLNVYYYNPITSLLQDVKFSVFTDSTLAQAAEYAHQRLKLDLIVPVEDCRLVVYNKKQDCIDCSYDSDEVRFCDIVSKSQLKANLSLLDWMLETRKPGMGYPVYKHGGINMKVYPINLETEEIEEPTLVRVDVDDTVKDLKIKLSSLLNFDVNSVRVVSEMYSNEPKFLDNDDDVVKFDANCSDYKLYVYSAADEDSEKSCKNLKLQRIIERFSYIISLNIILPNTDISILESLSIPSVDLNQNFDKLETSSGPGNNSPNLRISPQPGSGICSDGFGDQSNSEDSSLSDSDRTLVGEAPGECIALLSNSSNSPADQHMASPTDPTEDSYNYDVLGNPSEEMNWDEVVDTQQEAQRSNSYYFKVTSVVQKCNTENADASFVRCCKILVDKRMTLERFKKYLEPVVRVPMEYFKIFKQYPNSEEWSCLSDTLRSAKDGERLLIKLGRVLRSGELSCKVYHLKADLKDPADFLFEHIIAKGQLVSKVKREILCQAKKQFMMDVPYNKCRLREKNWRKPKKVYLDDQKFGDDITVSISFELFLQELPDGEKVTSADQLVLFVRHWFPSKMQLGEVDEIVMEANSTLDDLKGRLSEMCDVPVEFIEVVYVKCAFPCDVYLLDIHNQLDWSTSANYLQHWPLNAEDGCMFFYRDKREALKELTAEERKEITAREDSRFGRQSTKSYCYNSPPGRERALKIYLDTSPNKSEENCID